MTIPIATAMMPFDRERDGFLLGEGAAYLVLEELTQAIKRGARIYAEVIGYGKASDVYRATAPEPEGRGLAKAIDKAIRDADILPRDVQYINAHGTVTKLGDPAESNGIQRVFGEHTRKVYVSSTKPVTGHLLGRPGRWRPLFVPWPSRKGRCPST